MIKKLFIGFFLFCFSLAALASDRPQILITTSLGDIELELYRDKAPITVDNFLRYVKDGSYDGTIFHRVIKGFMIQGGGFTPDLQRKPTRQPIKNEADNGLKNARGTIAMARTNVPHSATSQFFINTVNNDFLNFQNKSSGGWGYAVFGKVIKGMDTVDKIENSRTGARGMFNRDVPLNTVTIEKIEIIKE